MTTHRRPLGTGPHATGTPLAAPAPRPLLPAERAEVRQLLEDGQDQVVPAREGRRILGPGFTAPQEGVRGEVVGTAETP
jgi:hypothetical protein